jgi:hypothetical protein
LGAFAEDGAFDVPHFFPQVEQVHGGVEVRVQVRVDVVRVPPAAAIRGVGVGVAVVAEGLGLLVQPQHLLAVMVRHQVGKR